MKIQQTAQSLTLDLRGTDWQTWYRHKA